MSKSVTPKLLIRPITHLDKDQHRAAATLLVQEFRHFRSAWKTQNEAEREVADFLPPRAFSNGHRAWAALSAEDQTVLGWVGAVDHYSSVWELHPLVVASEVQGQGIGGHLLDVMETAAAQAGINTVVVSSDDDYGGTSLFGQDLYPDVLGHLQALTIKTHHPVSFYQRHGYVVTGVVPDAAGQGNHDIQLSKWVGPPRGPVVSDPDYY